MCRAFLGEGVKLYESKSQVCYDYILSKIRFLGYYIRIKERVPVDREVGCRKNMIEEILDV